MELHKYLRSLKYIAGNWKKKVKEIWGQDKQGK